MLSQGTVRYSSIWSHQGIQQSRRDDLAALFYVLFYFSAGQLPWQGMKGDRAMGKYKKIGHKKKQTRLTYFRGTICEQLLEGMRKIDNLSFSENPDYETLRKLLVSMKDQQKSASQFDWVKNGSLWRSLNLSSRSAVHKYKYSVAEEKVPNRYNTRVKRSVGIDDISASLNQPGSKRRKVEYTTPEKIQEAKVVGTRRAAFNVASMKGSHSRLSKKSSGKSKGICQILIYCLTFDIPKRYD